MNLIAFYKPYGVLSQFTPEQEGDRTLAMYGLPSGVYPVGRLDKDSEGLLLLTNDGALKHRLSHPKFFKKKSYWVQVEHIPSKEQLDELQRGVLIKGGYKTRPAHVEVIEEPKLPQRDPPIRFRKSVPTCWLQMSITEGKNRQVRRMTAAVGLPTLRLVRVSLGPYGLDELSLGLGHWKIVKI